LLNVLKNNTLLYKICIN